MTFSITGFDPQTGMMGVAVATRYWAVGARVPYVRAGRAAIAVQAYYQPYIGFDTLQLMQSEGLSGPAALERALAADPGREWRQVGLVDADGRVAGFTGAETAPWSGHHVAAHCVAAGNMLAGPAVVDQMAAVFEERSDLALPERLVTALAAGHAAGGDRRGQQSAAVYVVWREEASYLDLRVDDHPDAIAELVRLVNATATDVLVRTARFAGSREAPPVEEYQQHKQELKRQGLA